MKAADKTMVGEVFDRAAPHYDRMNDVLSAGAHRYWKRLAARMLAVRRGMRVLDMAGGSGDMAKLFVDDAGAGGAVVLADINRAMLQIGRRRCGGEVAFCHCDAEKLPFADGAFDRAAMAFGLRNIHNRAAALAEMHRVLAVGGKMLLLEFSPPPITGGIVASAQRFYLRRVLPFAGRALFGDAESYRYLGDSIMAFLPPPVLAKMVRAAGFDRPKMLPLAAGAVQITTAWKLK
ncbi:MAG: ubiquinone/menaquinone biosynthesis methyltransferase [Gammaproteobacteria bacterium]